MFSSFSCVKNELLKLRSQKSCVLVIKKCKEACSLFTDLIINSQLFQNNCSPRIGFLFWRKPICSGLRHQICVIGGFALRILPFFGLSIFQQYNGTGLLPQYAASACKMRILLKCMNVNMTSWFWNSPAPCPAAICMTWAAMKLANVWKFVLNTGRIKIRRVSNVGQYIRNYRTSSKMIISIWLRLIKLNLFRLILHNMILSYDVSRIMRKPVLCHMRTTKLQISLRIHQSYTC